MISQIWRYPIFRQILRETTVRSRWVQSGQLLGAAARLRKTGWILVLKSARDLSQDSNWYFSIFLMLCFCSVLWALSFPQYGCTWQGDTAMFGTHLWRTTGNCRDDCRLPCTKNWLQSDESRGRVLETSNHLKPEWNLQTPKMCHFPDRSNLRLFLPLPSSPQLSERGRVIIKSVRRNAQASQSNPKAQLQVLLPWKETDRWFHQGVWICVSCCHVACIYNYIDAQSREVRCALVISPFLCSENLMFSDRVVHYCISYFT